VSPRTFSAKATRLGLKRGIDVAIAAATLLAILPFLAAVALIILATQGRPVIFHQTRVGRHGRPFTMFKFRTMERDAHARLDELGSRNERDGPLFKMADDPRATKIGRLLRRTSIDELPQLVNVLFGSMSMVGPRPALYEERKHFPRELLAREELRPGITGLWQVYARLDGDFKKYGKLDLDYVGNWNLRRDVKLLVQTPFVIAKHMFRRPEAPPVFEGAPEALELGHVHAQPVDATTARRV
jgi:lipopolysaccharide/colanic/teichoic acid biosynthesis glycosyltransferase